MTSLTEMAGYPAEALVSSHPQDVKKVSVTAWCWQLIQESGSLV